MDTMVSGEPSIGSGGVPPVIKTKPVTTATTVGTDLALLMATNNANQQQLITAIINMSNNTSNNDTVKPKTKANVVKVNYYR